MTPTDCADQMAGTAGLSGHTPMPEKRLTCRPIRVPA